VLDVKGENFDKTSRKRRARGDKVWRFAPVDWDRPTHRYNPLQRIAALPNPDQRQMELRKTANLFLQADGENAKGLLEGGIDLFVACGILAMERVVTFISITLGLDQSLSEVKGCLKKEISLRWFRRELSHPYPAPAQAMRRQARSRGHRRR